MMNRTKFADRDPFLAPAGEKAADQVELNSVGCAIPILNDFEVRQIARDAWRRQAVADERLESRLRQQRQPSQGANEKPQPRRGPGERLSGATLDLFGEK
jgi:hypothetical protein